MEILIKTGNECTTIRTNCCGVVFANLEESSDFPGRYSRDTDRKWLDFKRKHGLWKHRCDVEKWYDLYLRLCGEGLV